MFNVECEGCHAPYQLEERRIPPNGLKMRCAKCGTSFLVTLPGSAPPADLPVARQPTPAKPVALRAAPVSPPPMDVVEDDWGELDLPSPAADLPSLAPAGRRGSDLPVVAQARSPSPPAAPRAAPPVPPPPVVPPARVVGGGPPRPMASPAVPFDDLPAPVVAGLPAPISVGLPAPLTAGLPSPVTAALPARVSAGLPAPAPAGLPAPAAAGLPALTAALPVVKSSSFGEIDLPLLSHDALGGIDGGDVARVPSNFPPFDAPLAGGPDVSSAPPIGIDAELWGPDDPPAHPSSVPPILRAGGSARSAPQHEFELDPPASGRSSRDRGGKSFGEVDLPTDEAAGTIGLGGTEPARLPGASAADEDDMEFGAIPQAESTGGSVQLAAAPPIARVPSVRPSELKKSSRGTRIALGVFALVIVGGASLEVVTPYGAFGRHAIVDLLNRGEYAALETRTVQESRKLLGNDTFRDANRAIAAVDEAVGKAPRVRSLLAYGAFVAYLAELRYGRGAAIDAHAKQQLARLSTDQATGVIELARTAEAAVGSELSRAKQLALALAQRQKQDPDVALVEGEIELLAQEPQKALASFQRAERLGGATAQTVYGAARALFASGDASQAVLEAKKALELTPNHAGARVLIGRALWAANDEAGALKMLGALTAPGPLHDAASPAELVDALTLASRIHIVRSRVTQAETALADALKIDPKAGSALAGMGEVLYREGRFTDALARFDAGIQADPEGTLAKIGAAKTKIALERLQEAKEQLKKLRDARPADFEAAYWLGRAEESLGDRKGAEKTYRDAIRVGADKAETIDAYVALAQLVASQGRASEGEALLAEARKKLPDLSSLHRVLGEVHLSAGRFEAAKSEFEQTLRQDPDDLAARFKLGVTERRMGRFDEALGEFDKVAALDKEYPGLALERGLLYEASNRTREALDYYQQALSKAPDDPDLMLRVGSAEVSSGRASQAEEILRKVIAKRPNSAEVNHYLGRALLLKGTNLAEALRFLGRAAEIDPNRAEYHLYVGWAANDAGQPAVARQELEKALEMDQGLADGYWQKGVMQRKQGAVIDAVKNLQKALELRPSRYEAYAALAECYEDQNRTAEAVAAWRKAISAGAAQPEWHYRLGKLLGRAGESELRQAVTLAEPLDVKPGWLTQAYFELAEGERALGRAKDAIEHYRRFLSQAKPDSPYRADAIKSLAALGAPYDKE